VIDAWIVTAEFLAAAPLRIGAHNLRALEVAMLIGRDGSLYFFSPPLIRVANDRSGRNAVGFTCGSD
jgi:hypothetical protein